KNESYINWFIEEAHLENVDLKLIYRESLTVGIIDNQKVILYEDEIVERPTFAVVRVMEPILNMHLEACGINVFNNENISLMANNKIRTHDAINALGIPMVDTVYIQNTAVPDRPPFPYPFVLKDANNRGGKFVFFIHDQSEWKRRTAEIYGADLVIQRCNVRLGIDIRVFVVGKKIIGSVKRTGNNDFRANYTLGGNVTWYSLQSNETEMVKRIVNSFDFGMVGIDFLVKENGNLLFNEIEDIVGSRSLSKVSNCNILREYIKLIKQKTTNQDSI